jgi:hypothetical protein
MSKRRYMSAHRPKFDHIVQVSREFILRLVDITLPLPATAGPSQSNSICLTNGKHMCEPRNGVDRGRYTGGLFRYGTDYSYSKSSKSVHNSSAVVITRDGSSALAVNLWLRFTIKPRILSQACCLRYLMEHNGKVKFKVF